MIIVFTTSKACWSDLTAWVPVNWNDTQLILDIFASLAKSIYLNTIPRFLCVCVCDILFSFLVFAWCPIWYESVWLYEKCKFRSYDWMNARSRLTVLCISMCWFYKCFERVGCLISFNNRYLSIYYYYLKTCALLSIAKEWLYCLTRPAKRLMWTLYIKSFSLHVCIVFFCPNNSSFL